MGQYTSFVNEIKASYKTSETCKKQSDLVVLVYHESYILIEGTQLMKKCWCVFDGENVKFSRT